MSVLAPGHYYPAQLEQAPAVARLAWVYAWLLAEVTALVAVTLFVGAAVRHAVAAMSVTTAGVVLMWVMSSVEALEPVRPVLLVAQTVGWIWVASAIVPWNQIVTGLACMVGYTVVAGAWALLESGTSMSRSSGASWLSAPPAMPLPSPWRPGPTQQPGGPGVERATAIGSAAMGPGDRGSWRPRASGGGGDTATGTAYQDGRA